MVERVPDCDCCAGVEASTPLRLENPPGLRAIAYRCGRHGDFLASMEARLSSAGLPALASLTTRDSSDFTLALADALACSLDVVTFYAERFANEHYLRTATERLSVLEMARLIGYELAPGVAAGTWLAFRVQQVPGVSVEPVSVPVGTRVQSVPAQGEEAQTFETIEAITARADWNGIAVQRTERWSPRLGDLELWLDGVATGVRVGDAVLIVGSVRRDNPGSERWDIRVVNAVETDTQNERTRIRWGEPLGSYVPRVYPADVGTEVHVFRQRTALFGHNAPDPQLLADDEDDDGGVRRLMATSRFTDTGSRAPTRTAGTRAAGRLEWDGFELDPDALDLAVENPAIVADSWIALISNDSSYGSADLPGYVELYGVDRVMHRSRAAFGLSGRVTTIVPDGQENLTSELFGLRETLVLAQSERLQTADRPLRHPLYGDTLVLDVLAEGLAPGQALALRGRRQRVRVAAGVRWLELVTDEGADIALDEGDELFVLAPAVQLVGSTAVALDAVSFAAAIGDDDVRLRLEVMDRDGLSGTLEADGHEIALAASTEDDAVIEEIVFVAGTPDAVSHDRDRTSLRLRDAITHVYDRATASVNANVAEATHGEGVTAILGNGDGRLVNQTFTLNQSPLTYVSAATSSGRASTLAVRVNDVLWQEVPSLYGEAPAARRFETRRQDDGSTSVHFGDGIEGARLPSGTNNVRATWRKGIGVGGNVAANKLTTLLSRPLGVSEVTNPQAATGGEDAESLARARDNAPLTVLTLDRAVSVSDYADFARAFGGIDKAHALWVPAGPARGVFVTIAGTDGAPVPASSSTFGNLNRALVAYGDPLVPVRLASFTQVRFRCRLAVKVQAGFETAAVLAGVDTALGSHFSFAERQFGQPVSVDEVAGVAQGVTGVEAIHVAELYREGETPALVARLFAALPVASLSAMPSPAEMLTLATAAIEVMP